MADESYWATYHTALDWAMDHADELVDLSDAEQIEQMCHAYDETLIPKKSPVSTYRWGELIGLGRNRPRERSSEPN